MSRDKVQRENRTMKS